MEAFDLKHISLGQYLQRSGSQSLYNPSYIDKSRQYIKLVRHIWSTCQLKEERNDFVKKPLIRVSNEVGCDWLNTKAKGTRHGALI